VTTRNAVAAGDDFYPEVPRRCPERDSRFGDLRQSVYAGVHAMVTGARIGNKQQCSFARRRVNPYPGVAQKPGGISDVARHPTTAYV
jgi:hypothetical protein